MRFVNPQGDIASHECGDARVGSSVVSAIRDANFASTECAAPYIRGRSFSSELV